MTLSSTLPGWEGLGDSQAAQPHGTGIPGQTFSISYIAESLNSPSLQITLCLCEHLVDGFPNKGSTGCEAARLKAQLQKRTQAGIPN